MLPAIRRVPLVELGRIALGVRAGLRLLPRGRRRLQASQGRRGRGRSQELAPLHLPRRIRATHGSCTSVGAESDGSVAGTHAQDATHGDCAVVATSVMHRIGKVG